MTREEFIKLCRKASRMKGALVILRRHDRPVMAINTTRQGYGYLMVNEGFGVARLYFNWVQDKESTDLVFDRVNFELTINQKLLERDRQQQATA